ncbi:DUF3617 family protein [Asticcacaulis sp.]|uniref:DUF3617 family protein n=1 Tax=Asticcacaulis sp. TaxID=1872648 RepID=UPI002C1A833A|nr:DUF3617 family protein [Asticcacaulis sp.]HTM81763.1 DUF3617 family protein [Asticcacaulis sp.]
MTLRKAYLLSAGVALFAVMGATQASAYEKGRLWELDVQSQSGANAAETNTTWMCMSDESWLNPPKDLTGAKCSDPQFTREGDVVSWKSQCDAAQGAGQWTFSHGGKAIEGQSTVRTPEGDIVTGLEGKVVDRCTT